MIACPLPVTNELRDARSRLAALARLSLGHFPTPLVPMPRLQAELNESRPLWIKHDDYSGPGFGGNKVRKLEFELAAAQASGATDVLTTGGLRSNHCRITAALAASLRFRCHLVLNGEPPRSGEPEPASHGLYRAYGAQIHYVARGQDRAPALEALANELSRSGRRPHAIPLGASTPLGACGFTRAVFELQEQCATLGFTPGAIVHSTSSAGTQAGLAAGLRLAGWDRIRQIGVSADDGAATIGNEVRRILAGLESLLGMRPGALDSQPHVEDAFTGSGYGVASTEGNAAMSLLARCEGVVLDPVYTAKAMAGLIALRSGLPEGPVVFWHTGGQLALFEAQFDRFGL